MTSEIAVMNKQGIALAADSATTFHRSSKHGPKIFNSANKLFMLSKYCPVGIMIYGNSAINLMPWEILIKEYRRELGDKSFSTIREYSDHFLQYVSCFQGFSPEIEKGSLAALTMVVYEHINDKINTAVKALLVERGLITDDRTDKGEVRLHEDDVVPIIEKIVSVLEVDLMSSDYLTNFDANDDEEILAKFADTILEEKEEIFGELPISDEISSILDNIAVQIVTKSLESIEQLSRVNEAMSSGIVVAGFGDKEYFPALFACDVYGVINGKLRQGSIEEINISYNMEAAVRAFAQNRMIATFMQGVDPAYSNFQDDYIKEFVGELPDLFVNVLESIQEIDKEKVSNVREIIAEETAKFYERFVTEMERFQRREHAAPVTNGVAGLPKDELAEMAETLISLASFKQRVSLDDETVGGPIDVAVISKGDGFVWIKRKHYFQSELNQQFFHNYFDTQ